MAEESCVQFFFLVEYIIYCPRGIATWRLHIKPFKPAALSNQEVHLAFFVDRPRFGDYKKLSLSYVSARIGCLCYSKFHLLSTHLSLDISSAGGRAQPFTRHLLLVHKSETTDKHNQSLQTQDNSQSDHGTDDPSNSLGDTTAALV